MTRVCPQLLRRLAGRTTCHHAPGAGAVARASGAGNRSSTLPGMLDRQRSPVRIEVPFLDLRLSHEGLRDEILAELADVIDATAFVNGPQVAAFESDFAAYCGTAHCVGVSSGLDALRLSLIAAGLEPGEEVIVPA